MEAEKRLIQRWEKEFVGTPYVVHVNQYDCIGDIRQKITCNFGLIRSADHHEMIAEIATTKDLKRVIAARLRVPLNQVHLQFHSVLSDMKASATKELGNAIKGELTEEFEEFEEFEEAAADMMPLGNQFWELLQKKKRKKKEETDLRWEDGSLADFGIHSGMTISIFSHSSFVCSLVCATLTCIPVCLFWYWIAQEDKAEPIIKRVKKMFSSLCECSCSCRNNNEPKHNVMVETKYCGWKSWVVSLCFPPFSYFLCCCPIDKKMKPNKYVDVATSTVNIGDMSLADAIATQHDVFTYLLTLVGALSIKVPWDDSELDMVPKDILEEYMYNTLKNWQPPPAPPPKKNKPSSKQQKHRVKDRVKDKKMTYEKFAAKVAQKLGTMDPEKIFQKTDRTHDGMIDSKEFSKLVKSITKAEMYSRELVRAAWLAAVGGDATKKEISAEELQAWIKACQDPEEVQAAIKIQSIARGKRDRQKKHRKTSGSSKERAKKARRREKKERKRHVQNDEVILLEAQAEKISMVKNWDFSGNNNTKIVPQGPVARYLTVQVLEGQMDKDTTWDFDLNEIEQIYIGTNEDENNLVLADDNVDEEHAAICWNKEKRQLLFLDRDSNGTSKVNGNLVDCETPVKLMSGDKIFIGRKCVLTVTLNVKKKHDRDES